MTEHVIVVVTLSPCSVLLELPPGGGSSQQWGQVSTVRPPVHDKLTYPARQQTEPGGEASGGEGRPLFELRIRLTGHQTKKQGGGGGESGHL